MEPMPTLERLSDALSRLIYSERPLHDPHGTAADLRAILETAYQAGVSDAVQELDRRQNEENEYLWLHHPEPNGGSA